MRQAITLKAHGRPKKGEERKGDDITLKRGTQAAYLRARLHRDHPELAAALDRGEFRSARAAAIEAGIIRPVPRAPWIPCRYPIRYPVAPLQQINLKVAPAVMEHWRGQAAAAGLSVRDWLVSVAGPAAASAGPAADASLLTRVEALEAAVMALRKAVPRPKRPPAPSRSGRLPQRRLTLEEAEGLLTTPQIAAAIGVSEPAVTSWMERQEGGRHGAVGGTYRGFRLVGMAHLPAGRRPCWLWEPAEG